MKSKILEPQNEFKQIVIELTIESFDDLVELVKRLNISINDLNKSDSDYPDLVTDNISELWELLNDIYKGLK